MAWSSNSARSKTWTTEILTVADLHAQLDLLHTWDNDSMNGTTGHGHTGGTNDGKPIVLTTAVTGILPVANGGTGSATLSTVNLTGDQTIAGIKTFSSAIVSNLTGNVTGNLTGSAIAQMGSWASKVVSTIYQAATDGFLVGSTHTDDSAYYEIRTDSAATPTTVRMRCGGAGSTTTDTYSAFCCPIKKNDYYRIVAQGSGDFQTLDYCFFIPIGG